MERKVLLLFDGLCGLCNGLVRFLLARDRRDRFRFAPLQSALAREVLARHGLDRAELDTVWLIVDWGGPAERPLARGQAVLRILRELGGAWHAARVVGLLPRGLLDRGYDVVARRRHRWFGRYDACPLPRARDRQKFVGT